MHPIGIVDLAAPLQHPKGNEPKMMGQTWKFSLATLVFGLVAISSAIPQNQNRPVPNGQCCVANTSLKQDTCFVNGQRGRCVPGGNNCGSRLSCVAQSNLQCNNVIERGSNLCRARAPGGGLFDGARIIQNLGQATVN